MSSLSGSWLRFRLPTCGDVAPLLVQLIASSDLGRGWLWAVNRPGVLGRGPAQLRATSSHSEARGLALSQQLAETFLHRLVLDLVLHELQKLLGELLERCEFSPGPVSPSRNARTSAKERDCPFPLSIFLSRTCLTTLWEVSPPRSRSRGGCESARNRDRLVLHGPQCPRRFRPGTARSRPSFFQGFPVRDRRDRNSCREGRRPGSCPFWPMIGQVQKSQNWRSCGAA